MNDLYWLALSNANHLSFKEKYSLIEFFGYAENIFNSSFSKIHETGIIRHDKIIKLLDINPYDLSCSELYEKNIKICKLIDSEYPLALKNIYAPPVLLYYRGRLPVENCIAVVGSRKTTDAGRCNSYTVSMELAKIGYNVVSGMARGIDSCAHRGALTSGITTAVLGCGIDICYPPENKNLKNVIEKSGCVLSEYSPGRNPDRYTFPARNRIISGLSQAVVVVEAARKSGALITAEFALEQGRDVYAFVPENNEISIGTRELINDGAMPLKGLKDFISNLQYI